MAVEKNSDEISTIRDLLAEHSEGLPIKSISETIGMNRNSVAKYLDMLQMAGRVTLKRIGTAKIYCIANKMPVSAVLKLTKSHVIIFNQMLTVADINDSFTTLLKIPKREILGKTLDHLQFAVQSQPALQTLIKEGIRGTESKTSASIKIGNRDIPCTLTISPTFFENGQNGVSLIIDFIHEPVNGEITDNDKCDLPSGFEGIEYICRFTVDGTITYVNRAYSDLLQKTYTDLIGQNWRPPIPDVEYKKIKSSLRSLDSADPVAVEEFKVITPGGDFQWQRWKFRILFDQNGNPEGYQGNGFDITEIKNLKQKISRIADEKESLKQQCNEEVQDLSKQLYHEIASHEKTNFQLKFTQFAMDNASYMITWIAENGRFVYMNNEAQRVLGYHYRDVISKSFKDIFEGVFPLPWDEIWEVIKQKQQYSFETVLTTSQGIEIPVDMVLNYLEFKGKQYCCCFAKDITERKRAEKALKDSEVKYRNIFEKSVSGIFKTTPDGRLVDANDAFAHMYGYTSASEMLTSDLNVIRDLYVNPDDRNELVRTLEEKGLIENFETRQKKRDGTIIWVLITCRIIRDMEAQLIFYEGITSDITKHKKMEDRIRWLASFPEMNPNPVIEIDIQGTITFYNPATLMTLRNLCLPENPEAFISEYKNEVLREFSEGIESQIYREITLNKKTFAVTISFNRELHVIRLFVLDITGRKMAEEAVLASHDQLKKSEAELRIQQVELEMQAEDLRKSKIALEESRDKYLDLYEFAPLGYLRLTDKALIKEINLTGAALLGVERKNLQMARFSKFISSEYSDQWYQYFMNVKKQDTKQTCTLSLLREDGSTFPARLESIRIIHSDGTSTVRVAVSDITDIQKAEEALRESENRYRSLFENMLEGYAYCKILFDKDIPKDFVYIEVNHVFETLTGLKEVAGRKVSEVIPGIHDSNPELLRIYSRVALTGRTEKFETYLPLLDSHLSITVYSQQKGYFIAMFENITERKRAEESLQLHGEIVQNLAEGVVLISSSDGKIVYTNPRFESMFGYDANELNGRPISVVNAPYDKSPETTADEIINSLEIDGTWDGEVFNIRKDGTTFWCHATVSTFDHPQYGPVWVSVHLDITKRKRAEEALRVANKKLNLFSKVTRHDINNQMTIMRGFINRLEREQPEGSFTEYFHKINASGDQISALIELTKSYENIGVNTTDWQEVGTLVEAAVKSVELGPVRLENEIPDGVELFADPLIVKVFYNLLENAIRHGKTLTKIRFTSKEDAGDLIIFCEDDGVGVAVEDKEKIFKRGYSKDTRMSLFVAHEILDITDIRIRETGEPGKGSRFEMMVPKGMCRKQSPGDPV